jgi:hypothetical protein
VEILSRTNENSQEDQSFIERRDQSERSRIKAILKIDKKITCLLLLAGLRQVKIFFRYRIGGYLYLYLLSTERFYVPVFLRSGKLQGRLEGFAGGFFISHYISLYNTLA